MATYYNATCTAQQLGQGYISTINTCRRVPLSSVVTTRFYSDAACTVLQIGAIVGVDTCNQMQYLPSTAKFAKFSRTPDRNVTMALYDAPPCTGVPASTSAVVNGACIAVGTIPNTNATVYMRASAGVPWVTISAPAPTAAVGCR